MFHADAWMLFAVNECIPYVRVSTTCIFFVPNRCTLSDTDSLMPDDEMASDSVLCMHSSCSRARCYDRVMYVLWNDVCVCVCARTVHVCHKLNVNSVFERGTKFGRTKRCGINKKVIIVKHASWIGRCQPFRNGVWNSTHCMHFELKEIWLLRSPSVVQNPAVKH